jgi:hypothetical protein
MKKQRKKMKTKMKTKMKKQTKKMKEMMMISTSSKSAHDRNQLCKNSGDLLSSDPSSNKKNRSVQKYFNSKLLKNKCNLVDVIVFETDKRFCPINEETLILG